MLRGIGLILLVLAAASTSGCASAYKQPSRSEPFAKIVPQRGAIGPFGNNVADVEVIDGLPPNKYALTAGVHYLVVPGPISVIASARDKSKRGFCELRFVAQDKEEYKLSRSLKGAAFLIQILDKQGEVQAECEAPFQQLAPSNTYIYVPV